MVIVAVQIEPLATMNTPGRDCGVRIIVSSASNTASGVGTIENDFELTGPIERGDWEIVERHLEAIRATHPEFEAMYRVLADATVAVA